MIRHDRDCGDFGMIRLLALVFSLLLVLQLPLQAAGGNGPLWQNRAENALPEDEKHEPSLVPAVLGGAAGGVAGIEFGIVGVGIAAGSTASWWLLGGVGLVVGTVAGAWAGDHFFNRSKAKQPDAQASSAGASAAAAR
jgi:hypothetical protein